MSLPLEDIFLAEGLLDRLRTAYKGISVIAISKKIGVSKQSIYKWGRQESMPEMKTLLAIYKQTGCSLNWLLFNEGSMRASLRNSLTIDLLTIEDKLIADADAMVERKLFSMAAIILGGLLELHLLSLMKPDHRNNSIHLEEAATHLRKSGIISDRDESVIRICAVVHQKALQKDSELTLEIVKMMRDLVTGVTQQSPMLLAKVK